MKGIDIVLIARCTSAILAVAAAVTGILASIYWYRSSKVVIDPGWNEIEPVEQHLAQMGWTAGTLKALDDIASLNAKAAMLTAASVLFAATATLVGVIL